MGYTKVYTRTPYCRSRGSLAGFSWLAVCVARLIIWQFGAPSQSLEQFDDQPGSRRLLLLLGSFRLGSSKCLKISSDQMMADTRATVAGSVPSIDYLPVVVDAV